MTTNQPEHIKAALSLFPPRPDKPKRTDRQRIQLRSVIYLIIAIAIFPLWLWSIDRKIDESNRRRAELRAIWSTAAATPGAGELISGPYFDLVPTSTPTSVPSPAPTGQFSLADLTPIPPTPTPTPRRVIVIDLLVPPIPSPTPRRVIRIDLIVPPLPSPTP